MVNFGMVDYAVGIISLEVKCLEKVVLYLTGIANGCCLHLAVCDCPCSTFLSKATNQLAQQKALLKETKHVQFATSRACCTQPIEMPVNSCSNYTGMHMNQRSMTAVTIYNMSSLLSNNLYLEHTCGASQSVVRYTAFQKLHTG